MNTSVHGTTNARLWAWWVMSCSCGEFLGMAAAAGIAVGTANWLGEPATLAVRAIVMAIMVFAGAIEGLSIGYFQWRVLRKVFPELTMNSWIIPTITAAALGWMLGMLPSTFMREQAVDPATAPDPAAGLVAALAALLGTGLGAVFGVAQWCVLRRHARKAWTWIVANSIGWAIALVFIFLAASLPDKTTSAGVVVFIGASAGILAGLSIGIVTGWTLLRLRDQSVISNRGPREASNR